MEQQTYTLPAMTLDQINLVLAALGKQPFEVVADTVSQIRQHVIPQVQAQESSEQPNQGMTN